MPQIGLEFGGRNRLAGYDVKKCALRAGCGLASYAARGDGMTQRGLVIATRLQNGNDHQVRIGEEPLFGFNAGSFGGASNRPEVLVAGQAAQVIHADARQSHHFIFGEYLLAGLNSHHFWTPPILMLKPK
jgi:hypothetical protein